LSSSPPPLHLLSSLSVPALHHPSHLHLLPSPSPLGLPLTPPPSSLLLVPQPFLQCCSSQLGGVGSSCLSVWGCCLSSPQLRRRSRWGFCCTLGHWGRWGLGIQSKGRAAWGVGIHMGDSGILGFKLWDSGIFVFRPKGGFAGPLVAACSTGGTGTSVGTSVLKSKGGLGEVLAACCSKPRSPRWDAGILVLRPEVGLGAALVLGWGPGVTGTSAFRTKEGLGEALAACWGKPRSPRWDTGILVLRPEVGLGAALVPGSGVWGPGGLEACCAEGVETLLAAGSMRGPSQDWAAGGGTGYAAWLAQSGGACIPGALVSNWCAGAAGALAAKLGSGWVRALCSPAAAPVKQVPWELLEWAPLLPARC